MTIDEILDRMDGATDEPWVMLVVSREGNVEVVVPADCPASFSPPLPPPPLQTQDVTGSKSFNVEVRGWNGAVWDRSNLATLVAMPLGVRRVAIQEKLNKLTALHFETIAERYAGSSRASFLAVEDDETTQ